MASVDGARVSDKPTDAYYKFQCDPCAFSGLVKEASTYCKQCGEYMCVTCVSVHNGLKLARNHTMVSGSDLASTGQSGVDPAVSTLRTTCTCPESTGQPGVDPPVTASRSTGPELTEQSGVYRPVATSRSTCPESRRKYRMDMEVVSSTVINIPSKDVTGSAVMPDGRLILADCENDQIILLDQNFTVLSRLTLPGTPWDVAVYGNNAAVVTTPSRKQLQYIHVDMTLRAGHTIPTGLTCWGVAVHGGEIYVDVSGRRYGRLVKVMDTGGKVIRRIVANVHGTGGRSIYPGYINVGTGGVVYMSDFVSGRIACYTSTGHLVYDVKHEGMPGPMGMSVDKDDNLLVCCNDYDTIGVLGKDGAHQRVILSSSDGVVRPKSVSYRCSDQTLIVTMRNTPSCRAYKLN